MNKDLRIVVNHMEAEWGDTWIKNTFSKYGSIIDIEIPRRKNGKKKDICYIQFSKREECLAAIQGVNGQRYHKRILSVDFIDQSKKIKKNHSDSDNQEENEEKFEFLEPPAYFKFPRRDLNGIIEKFRPKTPPSPPLSPVSHPPSSENPEIKNIPVKIEQKKNEISDYDEKIKNKKREKEYHRKHSPPRINHKDHHSRY